MRFCFGLRCSILFRILWTSLRRLATLIFLVICWCKRSRIYNYILVSNNCFCLEGAMGGPFVNFSVVIDGMLLLLRKKTAL
jgi:hypothetical protein